ncbi:NADH(P)-binding-domain-containing protein [Ephemerocybe angulata]|uniref:NADH(P)-binding-domain-containing protein n=1 Tax=Ephemerocybe angulata TaxID=980116 RepID=A0A8H6HQE2_9AGAR|nr:NADH(P)-binding-domain-containing protein [Tulosesus angulatus]
MSKSIVIVGGHGRTALRLARLLSPSNRITSVIRSPSAEQTKDIEEAGATPVVLSLEDVTANDFTELFRKISADVVYFCAGAGLRASEERVEGVEYEGTVKICDAIEAIGADKRPRFISISALDIRDPDKIPEHYNEEDKQVSARIRNLMPRYIHWRYEADKNVVARSDLKWTIVRPGGLRDTAGTGSASLGKAHLSILLSRDDLASILAELLSRDDAAGLAIDSVGGDVPISEGVDRFIKHGVTDWIG